MAGITLEEQVKKQKAMMKEEKPEDQNKDKLVMSVQVEASAKLNIAAKEEEKEMEEIRGKLVETRVEEGKGKVEGDQLEKKGQEAAVEESTKMEVEPKTGVTFPSKLVDGKKLNAMGIRKKQVIALNINIYAFGIYADNAKLMEYLKEKFSRAPEKPTKELFEAVIDTDTAMVVRLVIVFRGLTMRMVRKNFDEGLGASIKKLTGDKKNEELVNKVMGAAKDSIKLSPGSIIEISRLPGNVLQTKVKDELVSTVESELLCKAYLNMYLGDDPFDKEAKEMFGRSLLSLF